MRLVFNPFTSSLDYVASNLLDVGVTSATAQYQVLTTGATPFAPLFSGWLLDGTTGGKTVLAITSAKTLTLTATDNFNLTIPATGTAALLATANVFTTQQMVDGTSDQIQLRVQGHSTQTANLQTWENSSGTVLGSISGVGNWGLGGTPSAVNRLFVTQTYTNAANESYGHFNQFLWNVNTTSTATVRGSYFQSINSATSNNQGTVIAVSSNARGRSTGGTTTSLISMFGSATTDANSAGNYTNINALQYNVSHLGIGTVTNARGISVNVALSPSTGAVDGNITNVYGVESGIAQTSNAVTPGVITTGAMFRAQSPTGAGAITTMYGQYVSNQGRTGITNAYGVYLDNISGATTLNYSIYTNAATNGARFGHQLALVGSTDVIQLRVTANATQTANVWTLETSASAIVNSMSLTAGAIFNEQGTDVIDFRVESDTEANMFFLDSSADTLYLGGTTDGIKVVKGGNMTFLGAATVWDDLRVEPTVRSTGTKAPSYVVYKTGIYAYEFNNALVAAEKEVNFKMQLPHGWKTASAISIHVHWVAKSTTEADQKVRWGLEYTKANINGVFGATTTIYKDLPESPPSTTPTADTHYLTDFVDIDMTGNTLSCFLLCRLFRNSSDAADTYTDSAFLIGIDAHIEMDSFGSSNELTK